MNSIVETHHKNNSYRNMKKIISCSKRTWCYYCMDACNFIIAVMYINTLAMMYAWRHRPHKIYSDITWKYDSAWSRFLVRLGNLAFGLRRVKHKYLFFLSRSFPWLCNSRSSSPHFHTFLSDIHSELCYILVRWL